MEAISGIFVINKPGGITSRTVVNEVQKVTGIRRCGHAGTLDPLATGVLVVAVGSATRLVSYVQQRAKTYRAEFRFGVTSDTDDITGNCMETANPVFPDQTELHNSFTDFIGEIEQVPPQYSAIKVQGKRAYDQARKGMITELAPRKVRIDQLQLLNYRPPDWQVEIVCGSGTYVRSIGRDIGQKFGCGAVMTSLIRSSIGDYHIDQAVQLEELKAGHWQEFLKSSRSAVSHLPQYHLTDADCQKIRNGQKLALLKTDTATDVAVTDSRDRLVAIAEVTADHILHPRIVFNE